MRYFLIILFVLASVAARAADAPVLYAFSPRQGATALVVKTIDDSVATIRLAAYQFTSRPIAEAITAACRRGVDVRLVLDKSQRNNKLFNRYFSGPCPRIRINPHFAILHDKFIVADDARVETGSFNFTAAAEKRNAENVVVISSPDLAEAFTRQWRALWDGGFDYYPFPG